jgi:hypothetical protein
MNDLTLFEVLQEHPQVIRDLDTVTVGCLGEDCEEEALISIPLPFNNGKGADSLANRFADSLEKSTDWDSENQLCSCCAQKREEADAAHDHESLMTMDRGAA